MGMEAITIGHTIAQLLTGFNILGLGSDPIAIALSAITALSITQGDILIKQKYSKTFIAFIACYAGWFTTPLASNWIIFLVIIIIGSVGIILDEATRIYRQGN